jgi:tetratricopeptide (TPR) repeat protein
VHDPDDFDARLADIDKALSLAPNFWAGLVAKAGLAEERDDFAGAARLYGEALGILRDDPGLLTQRAIALTRAGQDGEAERDFTQARTLAVDASTLNNICYTKAMAALALERALEECNASLLLAPDNPGTLDSRGTVLLQMGRLDEAIADFDRALEKSPNMAPSLFGRAVAWSRKGDPAKPTSARRFPPIPTLPSEWQSSAW